MCPEFKDLKKLANIFLSKTVNLEFQNLMIKILETTLNWGESSPENESAFPEYPDADLVSFIWDILTLTRAQTNTASIRSSPSFLLWGKTCDHPTASQFKQQRRKSQNNSTRSCFFCCLLTWIKRRVCCCGAGYQGDITCRIHLSSRGYSHSCYTWLG